MSDEEWFVCPNGCGIKIPHAACAPVAPPTMTGTIAIMDANLAERLPQCGLCGKKDFVGTPQLSYRGISTTMPVTRFGDVCGDCSDKLQSFACDVVEWLRENIRAGGRDE